VIGALVLYGSGSLDFLFPANAASSRPTSAVVVASTPTSALATTPTVAATPSVTPTPSPTAQPLVAVPNLVGKTDAEARALLEALQLDPILGEQVNDDVIPFGNVISQTIQPGTQLAVGQPVTYTLSRGPAIVLIDMPNFVNAPIEFARQQITALGLTVQVSEQSSQSIDEGFVVSQTPRSGSRVPPGSAVQIVVSRGDKVLVPRLKGLSEDQAKQVLAATDGALNYSYSDLQGPDKLGDQFYQVAPGTVVSSTPGENIWVPRGTYITLGVRAPKQCIGKGNVSKNYASRGVVFY
jgi:serine/threonine-protein kinase